MPEVKVTSLIIIPFWLQAVLAAHSGYFLYGTSAFPIGLIGWHRFAAFHLKTGKAGQFLPKANCAAQPMDLIQITDAFCEWPICWGFRESGNEGRSR